MDRTPLMTSRRRGASASRLPMIAAGVVAVVLVAAVGYTIGGQSGGASPSPDLRKVKTPATTTAAPGASALDDATHLHMLKQGDSVDVDQELAFEDSRHDADAVQLDDLQRQVAKEEGVSDALIGYGDGTTRSKRKQRGEAGLIEQN